MRTIMLHSGGLDSYVSTGILLARGYQIKAITFNYGQAPVQHEYAAAEAQVNWYKTKSNLHNPKIDLRRIYLNDYNKLVSDHPLVQNDAPAVGETKRDVIFIPGRNIVFLLFAAIAGWDDGIRELVISSHKSDITSGDCQPEFLEAFTSALSYGLAFAGRPEPYRIWSPLADMTKTEVVRAGDRLNVPMEYSWSCYRAGRQHCGVCHNCEDRKEAFQEAGIKDKTVYDN